MTYSEQAIVFPCAGEQLLGIVASPEEAASTGVLVVVGGPQYRAGSHRQFLLLSRVLASAGYPAMRFDYRGMGDSTGDQRDFDSVEEDIGAAMDAFVGACPGIQRIVLWGLCDAASAALLYIESRNDPRVGGMVLLNPWVRSEATLARAHIKHYYAQRLLQPAFWRKVLGGQLGIKRAIGGFLSSLQQARKSGGEAGGRAPRSFQERMLQGLRGFHGATLLILSGNDYTAKEFVESTKASLEWQAVLQADKVAVREVPDADHTFSSATWRDAVENLTLAWLDRQAVG